MSNQPVIEALKVVLADSYTLYLKTQNYHWNVEGPHFKSQHEMYQEQYEELVAAIDDIAERIRTLGDKAPGSYTAFVGLKTIEEATGNESDVEMLENLFNDQQKLVASIKKAQAASEKAEDEATMDLMVQRQQAHEKNAWMLRSSMPKEARAKQSSAA